MPEQYYRDILYPLQDKILGIIEQLNLDFYLTGGTALSRCYLQHRYSDDLDFFVNDHMDFRKQCYAAIAELKTSWACDIATTSDTFVRIFVQSEQLSLKIDFVNDVPFNSGDIQPSSIFYRIDSWRNILSNKLCALSRMEAKDIVDVVFIARKYAFGWETIVNDAREKDLWVEPIEICRLINQFPFHLLKTIRWIADVDIDKLKEQIDVIHDDIFTGVENSLVNSVSSRRR